MFDLMRRRIQDRASGSTRVPVSNSRKPVRPPCCPRLWKSAGGSRSASYRKVRRAVAAAPRSTDHSAYPLNRASQMVQRV